MALNLAELEQKIDRLLANVTAQNQAWFDLFFNTTAQSVDLEVYDDDGNLVTVSIPNRADIEASNAAAMDAVMIKTDTTIHVSPTGDDLTGDGSSGAPFASLAAALAWLADKTLASGAEATIELDDGVYTVTETIKVDHQQGGRILVKGKNTHATTTSAVSVGTGTATVTVADASDIDAGDMLIIKEGTGGTNPECLAGAWEVSSVNTGANQVTIIWPSTAANDPDGAVVADVVALKAVLKADLADDNYYLLEATGPLRLDDVGLTAADNANNMYAMFVDFFGSAEMNRVAVYGFKSEGVNIRGQCLASDCAVSGVVAAHGWAFGGGGQLRLNDCIASACGVAGFTATATAASIKNALSVNNDYGFYGVAGAVLELYGSSAVFNAVNGVYAQDFSLAALETFTASDNGVDYSPALNVTGNYESLIRG